MRDSREVALGQGQTMSPYGKQTELPRPPWSWGLSGSRQHTRLSPEPGSVVPGKMSPLSVSRERSKRMASSRPTQIPTRGRTQHWGHTQ